YEAIQRNVEKNLQYEKWLYRLIFFGMHLTFFLVTMLIVWGTVLANSGLRTALFNGETGAGAVVILPTIVWAFAILFHIASLYIESRAGEKEIRERLLMQEVGEEILRKGLSDVRMMEKPKRRAAALETERVLLSDEGEFIPADDDEHPAQRRV